MHDNIGPSGGYMIDLNDASDDVWRNYFAGQALASGKYFIDNDMIATAEVIYHQADAMMAEREKRKEGEDG